MGQVSWGGSGNGSWSVGANWSSGVAPGPMDDAVVAGTVGGPDLVVGGPGGAGSLTVLDGVGLSGSFGVGAVTVGSGSRTGSLDLMGAAVTAGRLSLNGGGVVRVDGSSVLEVGAAGGAGAGTLTVDAGAEAGGAGTISASGGIVDNGTLDARGGVLTLLGPVSGTGVLRIGAGATLALSGAGAPSTAGVAFAGAGTLAVGTTTYFDGTSIASGLTEGGVVSGFAAGDTIAYSGAALSSVSYADGGNGSGRLTLMSGSSVEGILTLAGSFGGSTFQVTPNGSSGSNIALGAPAGGGGGVPSAGTTTPDVYAWVGGGSWGAAGDWMDVTTGAAPAGVAPGARDLVTITGPAGSFQTIAGPGNAASLVLLGGTALSGAFNVGALTVGSGGVAGALSLGGGAAMAAGTALVADGSLQVAGPGTALTVSGGLRLGSIRSGPANVTPNLFTVAAGGAAQVGGGLDLSTSNGVADAVVVDSTSMLELGTAGGAGVGQVTVDAGASLTGAGTVSGAAGIVNDGTILATGGGLSLVGAVTGTGTMQIGLGGSLSLASSGAPTTEAVGFLGTAGTLVVGDSTSVANGAVAQGLSEQGAINGYAPGDVIHYAGATAVSGVSFRDGGGGTGTLTLLGAGGTIGTLELAGSYGADMFHVAADAGGGADISVTPPSSDPLVDAAYVYAHNPEVAAAGLDAAAWYHSVGWKEGANPDAFFNTDYYLAQNPDVAAAGYDPLAHYETNGWHEGRNPSAAFDTNFYLANNPDVAAAGFDPLQHYLSNGMAEGRAAYAVGTVATSPTDDPLVDAAYVYAHNPAVAAAGLDASVWYHTVGWTEGANPNAFFDTSYYLHQNPDVAAAGYDPLAHYETNGWKEGREPSLLFSTSKYLAANSDVAAAGYDPLQHYLSNGMAEGRAAYLAGSTNAVIDPLVNAAYYDAQLGATLIPTGGAAQQQADASYTNGGWQAGLNPDALFNTRYYLAQNPDVAAAGYDPLSHYETNGWHEGRNPSAAFSTGAYLAHNPDVAAAGYDPLQHYFSNGMAEGRAIYPA